MDNFPEFSNLVDYFSELFWDVDFSSAVNKIQQKRYQELTESEIETV